MAAELKFFLDSECTKEMGIVPGNEDEARNAGNYLIRILPDNEHPERLIDGVQGEGILYTFYVKNTGDKAALNTIMTVMDDPLGVIHAEEIEIGDIPAGEIKAVEIPVRVTAHTFAQVYSLEFKVDFFTLLSDTVHDIPYENYKLKKIPLSSIKYNIKKYNKDNGSRTLLDGTIVTVPYKDIKNIKPKPLESSNIKKDLA